MAARKFKTNGETFLIWAKKLKYKLKQESPFFACVGFIFPWHMYVYIMFFWSLPSPVGIVGKIGQYWSTHVKMRNYLCLPLILADIVKSQFSFYSAKYWELNLNCIGNVQYSVLFSVRNTKPKLHRRRGKPPTDQCANQIINGTESLTESLS